MSTEEVKRRGQDRSSGWGAPAESASAPRAARIVVGGLWPATGMLSFFALAALAWGGWQLMAIVAVIFVPQLVASEWVLHHAGNLNGGRRVLALTLLLCAYVLGLVVGGILVPTKT